MASNDETAKLVGTLGTVVSIALSVGGLAYSAGHLTNRVDNLEKKDVSFEKKVEKFDAEGDVIREQLNSISIQQGVIANDLSWLRRHLESKDK